MSNVRRSSLRITGTHHSYGGMGEIILAPYYCDDSYVFLHDLQRNSSRKIKVEVNPEYKFNCYTTVAYGLSD